MPAHLVVVLEMRILVDIHTFLLGRLSSTLFLLCCDQVVVLLESLSPVIGEGLPSCMPLLGRQHRLVRAVSDHRRHLLILFLLFIQTI